MVRRPICMVSFFYIIGIAVQYQFNLSKALLSCSIILGIAVFLFVIIKFKSISYIPLLVVVLLTGSLNYQLNYENDGKLSPFIQSEIDLVGDVLDASFKNNLQLTVAVSEISGNGIKYKVQEKVITSLKGDYYPPELLIGKRVKLSGLLIKPEKNRNPKMFNYQLYLKSKKIHAILYGEIEQIKVFDIRTRLSPVKFAYSLRYNLISNTLKILPEKEGRVLLGMLIGDKDQLDEELYRNFMEVGVAHILAVSGLHVGIIYLFIDRRLKKIPIHIRTAVICLILFIYMMITGYAPSILRATCMILLFMCSPLFNRKYDSIAAISFTALVLLIMNPILLMMTGFQLSFVAVLSIAFLYKPILKRMQGLPAYWAQLIAASLAAQIGIIPVTASYFNIISPWAPIVNIPIVIILGYLVPLGVIGVVFGSIHAAVAAIVGRLLVVGIKVMVGIAAVGGLLPFSGFKVVSPSLLTITLYYSVIFLIIAEDKYFDKMNFKRKKVILIILAFYVTVQSVSSLLPSKMEITFLDVGQGDCIIVRTPMKKTIIIDGGGNAQGTFDVGERLLVPYLLKNGIRKIDLMIVSHVHDDHVGGLYKVIEYLKTEAVIVGEQVEQTENYLKLITKCKERNIMIYTATKGDSIAVENNVNIKIVHPDNRLITYSRDDLNNNSLVALMEYKDMKCLFTGDIEVEGERILIENYPLLKADILKIPHHGSKYSSSDEFIEKIEPDIAVIQVGRNNFGHPNQEVLKKLDEKNISVFRNDENGAIIITIDREKMRIKKTL